MPKKLYRTAGDAVWDIGHHQLGGQRAGWPWRTAQAYAAGGEVVEDPLLVAELFLDVLGDRAAQPLVALGQARAPQAISSGTVCLTWW